MKKLILFALIVWGVIMFEQINAANGKPSKFLIYDQKADYAQATENVTISVKTTYVAKCRYKIDNKFGEMNDYDTMTPFENTDYTIHTTFSKWKPSDGSVVHVNCQQAAEDASDVITFSVNLDKQELEKLSVAEGLKENNASDRLIEQEKTIKLLNEQVKILNQIINVLLARLSMAI